MNLMYKKTYVRSVCFLERYFIGEFDEEPVTQMVCCAPMTLNLISPLKEEGKVSYPVIFKKVAYEIKYPKRIERAQEKASLRDYEFNVKLNRKAQKAIYRATDYFGSTPNGINAIINDAIVYFERFLHIIKSPDLLEIAEVYEKMKIAQMRKWINARRKKNYKIYFPFKIPTFRKMIGEDSEKEK